MAARDQLPEWRHLCFFLLGVCVLSEVLQSHAVKWVLGSHTLAATTGERLRFLQGMFNRTKPFNFSFNFPRMQDGWQTKPHSSHKL
jgi:hypothetical protein